MTGGPCSCAINLTGEHGENCPAAWWNEECIRASGTIECPECGKPYWRHAQVAKHEAPSLVRACDGRLLKL